MLHSPQTAASKQETREKQFLSGTFNVDHIIPIKKMLFSVTFLKAHVIAFSPLNFRVGKISRKILRDRLKVAITMRHAETWLAVGEV
jgi:hypothetical protein